ncbi:MAG: energy transducer TonB, partial [Bacteroidales bacterium]|nr:energy transducer TonB [Bacteroidales bacterium]
MSKNTKNINIPGECFSEQELLDYISGNLSEDKAKIISNHLDECEICSDVAEGLKIISKSGTFSANVQNLNNRIDNRIKQKKKKHFFTPLRSIAAAVLLLAALGSVFIINQYSKNINKESISRFEPEDFEKDTKQNSDQESLSQAKTITEEERITKTELSTNNRNIVNKNTGYTEASPSSGSTQILRGETEETEENIPIDATANIDFQEDEFEIIDTNSTRLYGGLFDNNQSISNASDNAENNIGEGMPLQENSQISANQKRDKAAVLDEDTELVNTYSQDRTAKETITSKQNECFATATQNNGYKIADEKILEETKMEDNEDIPLNIFYDSVEVKPVFPGGKSALNKFIFETMDYPQLAIEQNIEGTVYVKFIITKNGDVLNPTIFESVDSIIDVEAINIVKQMPKWEPGIHKGDTVNVNYILPVEFSLF